MGDSHIEQLQERVGERLGTVLFIVGAGVVVLSTMALAFSGWGYEEDWSSGYTDWSEISSRSSAGTAGP